MNIKIGPSGVGGQNYEELFEYMQEVGITAAEVPFTYGVNISNEQAKALGDSAKKYGISLSIHGPFYINLSSKEPEKVEASIVRILDSCERAHHMGAKVVVFHAGFYQGKDPELVYKEIKFQILNIQRKIKENGWNVMIAPEVTGKASQFGSIEELMRLHQETGCHICIDFSHIKARNVGEIDYDEVFSSIADLDFIHAHFSGIEWTAKGEKRHLLTEVQDIVELLDAVFKYKKDITIISESPDPLGDAEKILNISKKYQ